MEYCVADGFMAVWLTLVVLPRRTPSEGEGEGEWGGAAWKRYARRNNGGVVYEIVEKREQQQGPHTFVVDLALTPDGRKRDASDHYSLLKNDAHEQTTLCEPRRLIDVTGNIYKD
uniref:Uncharacterized protein K0048F05.11 n=1 Tax=Oryza sativa subsp. indica TaxID=39946 RepID=C8TF02_ORYSI|nr:hypothetical protein [Oryza sativa Indica Group]